MKNKLKRSAKPHNTHHEPDPLFLYWYQIFWGIISRVRRKDPVLANALLEQLITEQLLSWDNIMWNEGITNDVLNRAKKYRYGYLPSQRGKRRDKVSVETMAFYYGSFLGLLKELKKISNHKDRTKHFKEQLKEHYSLLPSQFLLVEHFKERAGLDLKRPDFKTIAYELTALVYGFNPESDTIRVYLSKAKHNNPTAKHILDIISSSGGLILVKSP